MMKKTKMPVIIAKKCKIPDKNPVYKKNNTITLITKISSRKGLRNLSSLFCSFFGNITFTFIIFSNYHHQGEYS
jgi:hypothetical protein